MLPPVSAATETGNSFKWGNGSSICLNDTERASKRLGFPVLIYITKSSKTLNSFLTFQAESLILIKDMNARLFFKSQKTGKHRLTWVERSRASCPPSRPVFANGDKTMKGTCRNCGADAGLHHYQTGQCPVGGFEAPIGRKQEWSFTTFEAEPQEPAELVILRMENAELRTALVNLGLAVNAMYLWLGSDSGAEALPFEPEWNAPLRTAYDNARAALEATREAAA